MKSLLTLVLILGVAPLSAADTKSADTTSSGNANFLAEAIERTTYVIEYDEKTGKATVKEHAQKQPFLDVTFQTGWKGDNKKAEKAIREALNEHRKKLAESGKDTPATLWSAQDTKNLQDFGDGFVIGFTAPFNFLKNALGGI